MERSRDQALYVSTPLSGQDVAAHILFVSRTYGDEDEGKIVREGFEPAKLNPATKSDFAVGDDDGEPQHVGRMHEDSEEARQLDNGQGEDQVTSSPEASTKYGTLDDRHVWDAKDGEDS